MRNLLKIAGKWWSIFLFILISCNKEGPGGTSTIIGKVYAVNYKNAGGIYVKTSDPYPLTDERIFLIYGDDSTKIYSEDTRTDWQGKYKFEGLRKGNYIVYAYSDDTTSTIKRQVPVFARVTIDKNREVVEAKDIYVVR